MLRPTVLVEMRRVNKKRRAVKISVEKVFVGWNK
jgi:hypothetical protein